MAEFLDKLKQKIPPQKPIDVIITLPRPSTSIEDIKVNVKIEDKRSEGLVDREEILRRLKEKSMVKEVKPLIDKPKVIVREEEKIDRIIPIITNVRKTARKIKIIVTKKEQITTSIPARKTPKHDFTNNSNEIASELVVINEIPLKERMHKKRPNVIIRVADYYQNNRQVFINFIRNIFAPYREKILADDRDISCENSGGDFKDLLTHQQIVRDYINLYTPYRGLLLYHGLGSGKTCSSIAIAEGLKTDKKVLIMTPASLKKNYREEIKNCGDLLYKKNQNWEFISTEQNPEYIDTLMNILSLSRDFIKKQGGAWLINSQKDSNLEELTSDDRDSLDKQLEKMIDNKYEFKNYNGLRNETLRVWSDNYENNPFSGKVVIIDEAHNFISRIVNKLSKPLSLSMRMYKYLQEAEDCKIILLSGTPIINYPNEIAVMFNILRGYIKTWTLTIKHVKGLDNNSMRELIKKDKKLRYLVDYINYLPSSKELTVTKNPFGYINDYKNKDYNGVTYNKEDIYDVTDKKFIELLKSFLTNNNIEIDGNIRLHNYTALPDDKDMFNNKFINNDGKSKGEVKDIDLFKRRILGLASYFPDLTKLMPQYDPTTQRIIVEVPMSDYQFDIYETARIAERQQEKKNRKKKAKEGEDDASSTYRIFSRAFCNYVFPEDIERPMPTKDGSSDINKVNLDLITEDITDGTSVEDRLENIDGKYELDDRVELEKEKDIKYDEKIKEALIKINEDGDKYLSPDALMKYGPKLRYVLDNITDKEHVGLHLLYSQFRTIEGIGIFKLVLENNGFVEFKLKKNATGQWIVDIPEDKMSLPTFALYTGTETAEEKEIIRKVFNGKWDDIPSLVKDYVIKGGAVNNNMGEVIKLLMITASGAEGISLMNVRYVHILEPYWHPVRLNQIIGRARRICSHKNLPKELQNVFVFIYLMIFTDEQVDINNELSREIRKHDRSKYPDRLKPVTSDELLYETSMIKEDINKQILKAVKEASIDCALHSTTENKEQLVCFNFGNPTPDKFSYLPNIDNDTSDELKNINKKQQIIKGKVFIPKSGPYRDKKFIVDTDKSDSKIKRHRLYNAEAYENGDLLPVGYLIVDGKMAEIKLDNPV